MRFTNWCRAQDRTEVTYWMGLLLLGLGLSLSVSIATALIVVGTVMVAESIITSYLEAWLVSRSSK